MNIKLSHSIIPVFTFLQVTLFAQNDPLQPIMGRNKVGFSQLKEIIQLKDNRIITCIVDMWFPAPSGKEHLVYKDYFTQHTTLLEVRESIHSFFGVTADSAWNQLLQRKSQAYKNLDSQGKKLPLILGMLRPVSTTNTCELLASQGYVVAMINQVDDFPPDDSTRWNAQMKGELQIYDAIIQRLSEDEIIDANKVGLLGFSGSGFSQFLYAMQSSKPKCIALLESGLYADGLFDAIKKTGLYFPERLKAPFLYFHNGYTDLKNPYREEFEKIPGNRKHKVLYMDSTMHHWDFASEGFLSSSYLNNRKQDVGARQLKNYLNANARLIDFFNEQLRGKKSVFQNRAPAGSKVR